MTQTVGVKDFQMFVCLLWHWLAVLLAINLTARTKPKAQKASNLKCARAWQRANDMVVIIQSSLFRVGPALTDYWNVIAHSRACYDLTTPLAGRPDKPHNAKSKGHCAASTAKWWFIRLRLRQQTAGPHSTCSNQPHNGSHSTLRQMNTALAATATA